MGLKFIWEEHGFEVHLGGRERVKLKTYKDFVSVVIEQGLSKHFGKSVGLMGDSGKGRKFARDSEAVLDDMNVFGQEWQVMDTDPTIFLQTARFPQYPQKCTMPTPKATSMLRRRLSESSVDELAAEKACEHWGEGKDDCIFDVLTTGDLEMAMVGTY
jgi:tRNA G37 N-methylase TrmD